MHANLLDEVIARRRAQRALPDPSRCRSLREAAQLTQEDLASVLGVTRAAVSRWELGERRPRAATLERYLAALERLAQESL